MDGILLAQAFIVSFNVTIFVFAYLFNKAEFKF